MSAQNRILDKLIARSGSAVTASIADYKDMGQGLVKVVATFSRTGTKTELREALAHAVDGMGQAVGNSFVAVPGAMLAAVGFMFGNPESKPYTEAAVADMKCVTANVLLDADDRVWSVRDTAAGKLLVRNCDTDIGQVVASVKTRAVGVPVLAALGQANVNAREFVTYVSPLGELRRGFAIATIDDDVIVVPLEQDGTAGEEETVSDEQVVDTRHLDDDVLEEITAAPVPTTTSKESMKEYYSKVYGYNPEYLAQFLAIIDENKAL